jgi:hypothetical protein
MKTIDDIRYENLHLLIAEAGGDEQLAERYDCTVAYIRNMKLRSVDSGTGKQKNIGKNTARKLEASMNKPVGWMDTDHTSIGAPTELYQENKNPGILTIPQYETGGAMGTGVILPDQPGQIMGWDVTPEWVEKNIPNNTGKNNLCIVTGFGDSMKGMFNSGDPLIVDRGVKSVTYDAVYFFRVGEEGFIKRLQRIPGKGILVISKNPDYRDWYITKGMDFEVFGRVLKGWEGKEF